MNYTGQAKNQLADSMHKKIRTAIYKMGKNEKFIKISDDHHPKIFILLNAYASHTEKAISSMGDGYFGKDIYKAQGCLTIMGEIGLKKFGYIYELKHHKDDHRFDTCLGRGLTKWVQDINDLFMKEIDTLAEVEYYE